MVTPYAHNQPRRIYPPDTHVILSAVAFDESPENVDALFKRNGKGDRLENDGGANVRLDFGADKGRDWCIENSSRTSQVQQLSSYIRYLVSSCEFETPLRS